MPTGWTVYEGPSTIDGEPIVAVLTMSSANKKTGPIPQLWILRQDRPPHDAVKDGADVSVCGGCPARGGWCYVPTWQAPLNVWKSWAAGKYPADPTRLAASLRAAAPRAVRLGAYGEPVAVPLHVMQELVRVCRGAGAVVLGYSHRWMAPGSDGYQSFLMASVDSPAEQRRAASKGWRTYRSRLAGEPRLLDEEVCFYQSTHLTCNACRRCDGTSGRPGNIVADVHGSPARLRLYRAMRNRRADVEIEGGGK